MIASPTDFFFFKRSQKSHFFIKQWGLSLLVCCFIPQLVHTTNLFIPFFALFRMLKKLFQPFFGPFFLINALKHTSLSVIGCEVIIKLEQAMKVVFLTVFVH